LDVEREPEPEPEAEAEPEPEPEASIFGCAIHGIVSPVVATASTLPIFVRKDGVNELVPLVLELQRTRVEPELALPKSFNNKIPVG